MTSCTQGEREHIANCHASLYCTGEEERKSYILRKENTLAVLISNDLVKASISSPKPPEGRAHQVSAHEVRDTTLTDTIVIQLLRVTKAKAPLLLGNHTRKAKTYKYQFAHAQCTSGVI